MFRRHKPPELFLLRKRGIGRIAHVPLPTPQLMCSLHKSLLLTNLRDYDFDYSPAKTFQSRDAQIPPRIGATAGIHP